MSIEFNNILRNILIYSIILLVNFPLIAQQPADFTSFNRNIQHLPFKDQVDTLAKTYESKINHNSGTALIYLDQAIELCRKISYNEGLALHLLRKGNYYLSVKGNLKKAEVFLLESLKVTLTLDDDRLLPGIYNRLGGVSFGFGNYEETLLYFEEGRKVATKRNNRTEMLDFTMNMAVVELKIDHYQAAKERLLECLLQEPNDSQLPKIYNNLGIAYVRLSQYDSALIYYNKSIGYCGSGNTGDRCRASALNNIATAQLRLEKYEEAISSYKNLEVLLKESGQNQILTQVLLNKGIAYKNLNYYDSALVPLQEAEIFALQYALNPELKSIYFNLVEVYKGNKKYSKALEQYGLYEKFKDSLRTIENSKNAEEIIAKYETEKKEKQIALLTQEKLKQESILKKQEAEFYQKLLADSLSSQKKEIEILQLKGRNEVQSIMLDKNRIEQEQNEIQILLLEKEKELKVAEAERQSLIRNTAIAGSLLILIPTFILLVVYKQKIKDKELLATKSEEINRQKTLDVIKDFELKAIKASIEGQEKEKKRIALELHDGIAGNLAGIKLMLSKVAEKSDNISNLGIIVEKIDDTYQEVRTITHHLTPPKIENDSFSKLIDEFLIEIKSVNSFKINFICHPKKDLDLLNNDIKIEIYRIIQELMSNIIKHADTDTVEIQLVMNEQYVNLMVEDNGIGFDAIKAKSAKGIGLLNIYSRVSKINGNIDIDSSPGRGTIFNIDIPVTTVNKIENHSFS